MGEQAKLRKVRRELRRLVLEGHMSPSDAVKCYRFGRRTLRSHDAIGVRAKTPVAVEPK